MSFKVGDVVVCIKENNLPEFINTKWVIKDITGGFYQCFNPALFHSKNLFPFRKDEIVLQSILLEELL